MAFETTIKAVRIIDDVETIRIFADPVRSEILRQVGEHPLTEAQLAMKLNLTKSSVWHHLQTLIKAGLIRVERTEVESHGIQ